MCFLNLVVSKIIIRFTDVFSEFISKSSSGFSSFDDDFIYRIESCKKIGSYYFDKLETEINDSREYKNKDYFDTNHRNIREKLQ